MRKFIFLSSLILFSGGQTSQATILYVGSGENYTTISQAMWDVKDGDTIMVRDGIYDQSIDVRNAITIMAENRGKAIFGDGAGNEGILRIRRSDVIIDGFKFNGIEEGHGIILMGSEDTPVNNCILKHNEITNRAMGIMVSEYAGSCTIDSNIITGCDDNGIHHNGKGANNISNNRIQNNSGSGIVITNAFRGSVVISGDTILQNGDDGIRLFSSGITIQGNVIQENEKLGIGINPGATNITISKKNQIIQNGLYGIQIYQGSYVAIDDNLINNHPDIGILIDANGAGTITNNVISENQSSGIENSGSAVITGNTIINNHSHGIENLETASNTWIENNRISKNIESGVSLREQADIRGNIIDSNGVVGVNIAGNIDTVFITGNNQISSNIRHGILVAPGSPVVIRNNQITDNGDPDDSIWDISGIFTDGPAIIEGNVIDNNESHGVLVATGSTNTIIRQKNKIRGNDVGILMLSPGKVDSNIIQNNDHEGILVRSTNTLITRNDISGNRQGIALDEQATNIKISRCNISNNHSGIVSSGQFVQVRRTTIKNNTLVGVDIFESGIDLGLNEIGEEGRNIIGQNGVCNISNMTSDTIFACHNYWDVIDTAKIDETLCDDDEDQQFGPVIYHPFLTEVPTGIAELFTLQNDFVKIGLEVIYPNPFIDEINISYHVVLPMEITSRVLDIHGRVIATLIKGRHHIPGHYNIQWNGRTENKSRVPAGVYVIFMEGDGFICATKVQMLE